ncbi:MAG TPA: leucine--tRNA ligase [Thermoclostridium caenicola]|uniref:leucine--tRNA ligase n=1 Tax=Thermoclostridium caenicola TaxID=659425 RepID=UPI002CAFF7CE|nr:leucine--tRNA ligase [Thermoclostridium caenicola]HOK42255.1 leucine--tRNA ligase [Thermoclostridium caenicola]HOL84200.1 leucine--tRNA ligase [Thermoclostridium caenicola]HOP71764.1 leucine--tRNA ligase [Thermoclostridium caenicola]HPO75968.1 leucine--tRNA ligase [Thermoclostridium caenicola]HPU21724.1 leucine--tRNA ligase [Thermoclostridium caenicola]
MAYSTEIDRKWQKKWEETQIYKFDKNNMEKKLYCLEMFSYPSGAKLHAGHWFNFGLTDSWARMKRMQGYNVFHPQGFDAFGLPAENYAIKTGIHPKDSTMQNIATMEEQLKRMGATFDWDYEVITCLPEYYKWTQWIFLQLYKHGLAYRKNAPVNWCPSCKTVLANEQVIDGCCERCNSEVTKKNLTQWFFKITQYAQELLDCLPQLDWPEKTKKIQTNWIGRSEGAEIEFQVAGTDLTFRVFTTRADTLYGVTYVVLAPEHELVDKITTDDCRQAVEDYREAVKKVSEIDRMSTVREKTGVFTGAYAIHPLTGEKVPIWIADYVLAGYGTGCVMAVPAHDERDYEFATKYNLEIRRVIKGAEGVDDALPFTEYGILTGSREFDGYTSEEARIAIVRELEGMNKGELKVTYRLRDWLVSRQRYWGAPIPIIYCDKCGTVPVPEDQLPVELPYNVVFTPDGESPLAKCEEFVHTTCPCCGGPAKRDTDTLDTFVCSSWYYLRYPDNKNDKEPFNRELINRMLPVDKYVGGAEHAAMHLLYARFFTKALRDMGYLDFDEPFLSLVHQGTILGADGQKMSKSRGNTVSPDEYIEKYGSDVFRMYLAFGFSYVEGGPWSDEGIKAMDRFIARVERLITKFASEKDTKGSDQFGPNEKELNYIRHYAIKSVTEDTEVFQFNTAIARLMELINALYKYDALENRNMTLMEETIRDAILLMSPFAPHFAEEMWERMGYDYSVFNQPWPSYDEKALVRDEIEMAVQFNGQVKYKINVPRDADNQQIEQAALSDERAAGYIGGRNIVKVIVVKGRLINIVVK